MDQEDIQMSCKLCKKEYPLKSLVRHAEKNKECKHAYSSHEIQDLKAQSKQISAAKKKKKAAERYQRHKAEIAAKYQDKKPQVAEQYQMKKGKVAEQYQMKKGKIAAKYQIKKSLIAEKYQMRKSLIAQKYDKSERAMVYKRSRVKISLKYYKKKHGSYDKELRRQRYKKVMNKIRKDRKELIEMKKSEAGQIFSEVFGYVVLDDYNEFESDNLDCALGMQEKHRKDLENEFHDEVFEKEEWIRNFNRKTFDCGEYKRFKRFHDSDVPLTCSELADQLSKESTPEEKEHVLWCLQHISNKKVHELIVTSMREKFNEPIDKILLDGANVEFTKEMKCIFGRRYSPLWLPIIYSDVKERCLNRAFRTLFSKSHSDIYEKSKASAITLWQNSKDETEFSVFLIEQLEASGIHISEKISEIFKNDFLDTLEKEFSFFKERIPCEMRSKNEERKKWAIKKLEKIQAFEMDSMDKAKTALIEDARIEIQRIYQEFEEEITEANKNCNVLFEDYFCFSDVVGLYPTFKGPTEDPLFDSPYDEYDFWFFRIWHNLENRRKNRRKKCACHTCSNNLNLKAECERVTKQKELECYFFTCPLCKNNMLFEYFYEKDKHRHFSIKYNKKDDEISCCD